MKKLEHTTPWNVFRMKTLELYDAFQEVLKIRSQAREKQCWTFQLIPVDMVKKEAKNYSKITLFTVINVFPQAYGPLLLNQGEDRNPTIIQEELRGMQHATLPATRFFPACFSLAMCLYVRECGCWRGLCEDG